MQAFISHVLVFCSVYWCLRLIPLGTSAPDDGWWWVWSSRWNEWQGKPKYSKKNCSSATCPPQIPHDLIWNRTLVAAVGSRPLTARAMTRPKSLVSHMLICMPKIIDHQIIWPHEGESCLRSRLSHSYSIISQFLWNPKVQNHFQNRPPRSLSLATSIQRIQQNPISLT
jgi:hypothetical protein